MQKFFALVFSLSTVVVAAPKNSYLSQMKEALARVQNKTDVLSNQAEKLAEKVAKGGNLLVSGRHSVVSELVGRAGGPLIVQPLTHGMCPSDQYSVIQLGSGEDQTKSACAVMRIESGEYSPISHLEGVIDAAVGWAAVGEIIAALTRFGKMPILSRNLATPDGRDWMGKYAGQAFHSDLTVSPVPKRLLSKAYLTNLENVINVFQKEEKSKLAKLRAWLISAKANKKPIYLLAEGHMVPLELFLLKVNDVFQTKMPPKIPNGSVFVYVAYHAPPSDFIQAVLKNKGSVAYISVSSDIAKSPRALWINPHWESNDASVEIPGYPARALPVGQVLNTLFALEIYREAKG